MAYKNVQHYRHTVHRYLDAIWSVSSHKKKARSAMYKLLSNRMGLEESVTHVSMFNREQCKQAIKILRPMYIQFYGRDLEWKKKNKKGNEMYYSNKSFTTVVGARFENKSGVVDKFFNLHITIYCRSKSLGEGGSIINLTTMETAVRKFLDNKCLNDVLECQPTLERLAYYICEQIIPCYKVKIKNDNGEEVIYVEDEE